jgi:hypothetical protein
LLSEAWATQTEPLAGSGNQQQPWNPTPLPLTAYHAQSLWLQQIPKQFFESKKQCCNADVFCMKLKLLGQ